MKLYFIAMACIAMMAASCGNDSSFSKRSNTADDDSAVTQNSSDSLKIPDSSVESLNRTIILNSGGSLTEDFGQKLIRTADINIELKDYNSFNNRLHASLKSYGAYVSAEDQQSNDGKIENKITVKVPVDQFEDLINSFNGDGVKINEKNITSQDVTGEIVDTKARLDTKKEVRDRYVDLLKNTKSEKNLLSAQSEVDNAQQDVESSEARINYLKHNTAYSTINLDYFQILTADVSKNVEPSFLHRLHDAFSMGSSFVGEVLIFFTSIWPLFIGLLLLFILLRQLKNKKTSSKTV